MVRNYIRKSYKCYTKDQLKQAVAAVKTGVSLSDASALFGIPKNTISYRHIQGDKPLHSGAKTALSEAVETELALHLRSVVASRGGTFLRAEDVKDEVEKFVLSKKLLNPFRKFKASSNPMRPGDDWLLGFLRRNDLMDKNIIRGIKVDVDVGESSGKRRSKRKRGGTSANLHNTAITTNGRIVQDKAADLIVETYVPIKQSCNVQSVNGSRSSDCSTSENQKCTSTDALVCGYCPKTFMSTHLLTKHMGMCHAFIASCLRYICPQCSAVFKTPAVLAQHVYVVHGFRKVIDCKKEEEVTMKYSCDYCSLRFSDLRLLRKHTFLCSRMPRRTARGPQTVSSADGFQPTNSAGTVCLICGLVCVDQRTLQVHLDEDHHYESVKRTHENCLSCQKGFKAFTGLIDHFYVQGKPLVPWLCGYCKKVFALEAHYQSHLEKAHAFKPKVACQLCDNFLDDFSLLTKHLQTEHGKFYCQICSAVFNASTDLVSHMLCLHKQFDPNFGQYVEGNVILSKIPELQSVDAKPAIKLEPLDQDNAMMDFLDFFLQN